MPQEKKIAFVYGGNHYKVEVMIHSLDRIVLPDGRLLAVLEWDKLNWKKGEKLPKPMSMSEISHPDQNNILGVACGGREILAEQVPRPHRQGVSK